MTITHAFAMLSTTLVVGAGTIGYAASTSNASEVGNGDAEKNVIEVYFHERGCGSCLVSLASFERAYNDVIWEGASVALKKILVVDRGIEATAIRKRTGFVCDSLLVFGKSGSVHEGLPLNGAVLRNNGEELVLSAETLRKMDYTTMRRKIIEYYKNAVGYFHRQMQTKIREHEDAVMSRPVLEMVESDTAIIISQNADNVYLVQASSGEIIKIIHLEHGMIEPGLEGKEQLITDYSREHRVIAPKEMVSCCTAYKDGSVVKMVVMANIAEKVNLQGEVVVEIRHGVFYAEYDLAADTAVTVERISLVDARNQDATNSLIHNNRIIFTSRVVSRGDRNACDIVVYNIDTKRECLYHIVDTELYPEDKYVIRSAFVGNNTACILNTRGDGLFMMKLSRREHDCDDMDSMGTRLQGGMLAADAMKDGGAFKPRAVLAVEYADGMMIVQKDSMVLLSNQSLDEIYTTNNSNFNDSIKGQYARYSDCRVVYWLGIREETYFLNGTAVRFLK
ncbi:MAG: hypothetical protein KFH87_01920 [Bacteroidetes bacterium]|nr:hypothetical protein [Bacteroidota bacterium]